MCVARVFVWLASVACSVSVNFWQVKHLVTMIVSEKSNLTYVSLFLGIGRRNSPATIKLQRLTDFFLVVGVCCVCVSFVCFARVCGWRVCRSLVVWGVCGVSVGSVWCGVAFEFLVQMCTVGPRKGPANIQNFEDSRLKTFFIEG